jgi:hypothetical protein
MILEEILMNVLGISGAIAKSDLSLHGDIEHIKASHQLRCDCLHPRNIMRATTEFVRDVTIVEFLHHLKLDM